MGENIKVMTYIDYLKDGGETNLNTIAKQFEVKNVFLPQPVNSKLYSYSFLKQLFDLWQNEKVSPQNDQNTSVNNSTNNTNNRSNGSIRSFNNNTSKHKPFNTKLITPSNI